MEKNYSFTKGKIARISDRLPVHLAATLGAICRRILCLVLLLGQQSLLPVAAQTPSAGTLPPIIPPSPNAAALEKYGQVPVSAYTGVPNISVPLYEIKVRDLSIPLTLSYHSGGFRVSEEASWVGLGWSLQAGGAVTRSVRDLDDLTWFFPRYAGHTVYPIPEPISPFGNPALTAAPGSANQFGNPYAGIIGLIDRTDTVYIKNPADSTHLIREPYGYQGVYTNAGTDWEPDDFRFTAGNYSGQFAFDQKGRIHLLEQQKVLIEHPGTNGPDYWKITAPDGFQYFFGAAEISGTNGPRGNAITAWYLTRMVSPLGEEATFVYTQGANVAMQPILTQSETKGYSGCGQSPPPIGYSGTTSIGGLVPQYLSRINFATGYVLFDRDPTLRSDLQGAQRLQRIRVFSLDNQLCKSFDLQTSYFEAPIGNTGYTTPSANNITDLTNSYERKRLRLDAVVEKGRDGVAKPATTFHYNTTPLPVKSSYSVDFWGYYNGVNNMTLIPRYAGPGLNATYVSYSGADRTPNAASMQAGILTRITYPTGGSTSFTFEPHEYGNITEQDIQTSTALASPVIRFRADNVDPNGTIPSTRFTVTEATPITIVRYSLSVDYVGSQQYTYLSLIDDATGLPFTSSMPGNGSPTVFTATWYFPPANANGSPTPNQLIGSALFVVPAGSYHFEARLPNCDPSNTGSCRAIVEVVQGYYSQLQTITAIQANSIKLLAGGLRIKRIETRDGLDPLRTQVRVYQYGPGTLMAVPAFKKISSLPNEVGDLCYSFKLSSNSFAAFSAGAKGSSVGYSQVDELYGAQGEDGKISYFYHNLEDRKIEYGDRQPNIPTRADTRNGYLREQRTYRKEGNAFQIVSATENTYEAVNQYDLPAIFRGEEYALNVGAPIERHGQVMYYILFRHAGSDWQVQSAGSMTRRMTRRHWLPLPATPTIRSTPAICR